jgi:hypothetical protein
MNDMFVADMFVADMLCGGALWLKTAGYCTVASETGFPSCPAAGSFILLLDQVLSPT